MTTDLNSSDTQRAINEELFLACENNDLPTVRRILTDPDLHTHAQAAMRDNSLLEMVCRDARLDILDYLLLEHSSQQLSPYTVLNTACEQKSKEVVMHVLTSPKLQEKVSNLTLCDVLGVAYITHQSATVNFLLYDMNIAVREDEIELLTQEQTQELRHLVQKRDTFVKLQELASRSCEDTSTANKV